MITALSSLSFWTRYWYWWLLSVFISWLVMELLAILVAHVSGQQNIQTWTLSDTIRRWAGKFRLVAPFAVGVTSMLLYHFFIQANQ